MNQPVLEFKNVTWTYEDMDLSLIHIWLHHCSPSFESSIRTKKMFKHLRHG